MAEVFVVRNQLGHYWGKKKRWVDGSNPHKVLHSPHHDEALNTLFELSSRDIDLRGEVITVPLTERGEPVVKPSAIPLPEEPEEEATGTPETAGQGEAPADAGPAEETPENA